MILIKGVNTISLDIPHLKAAAQADLADLILAERISLISLAISSVISLAAAEAAQEIMGL